MKIKSGKTTIEVSVEELTHTVRELKEQLAEITGFTDIKLIHAGKVLKDEDTIGSIPGGLNAKLTMMGSTPEAIESLKERDTPNVNNKRIIDDLSGDVSAVLHTNRTSNSGPKQYNPYKFQSIQTLPNLPNEDKAREILTTLANDEGILAVMKKHKWSVGALCELYPEGYVGVSDVCVMGLNENHGQRILLRLRTDDLKGFRKILSIRKVLCHELAHNVHSEHDDNFYVLMRQVEREIVELDWKNGKGRSLSGQAPSDVYTPVSTPVSAAPVAHRLGGSTDPLVQQLVPARYLAGTAAIMRLSAEEKEVEDSCASARAGASSSVRAAVQRSVSGGEASAVEKESPPSVEAPEHIPAEETPPTDSSEGGNLDTGEFVEDDGSHMDVVAEGDAVSSKEASERQVDTSSGAKEPAEDAPSAVKENSATILETVTQQVEPEFAAVQEAVLLGMDESIALSLSMESAAAPVEKQLALREAVSTMLAHINSTHGRNAEKVAALRACLKVLIQVILNAKVSNLYESQRRFELFSLYLNCCRRAG
jgi:hypothetical protein